MSSSQPTTQVASAHANELQWLRLKTLIRTKYLIHDESLETIVKALKSEPLAQGLTISKQIVERRLKKWGLYKNLSVDTWRHVGNAIDERKQQNKDSVVILSGKRLDSRVVDAKVNRHKPLLEYTAPKVKPLDPDIPLDICTPRATDLDITHFPTHYQPWPENLPWFEFNRTISLEIVPSGNTLPQPVTTQKRRLESSSNPESLVNSLGKRHKRLKSSQPVDSEAAQADIFHGFMLKHLMKLAGASLELNSSLVASRSIDRLAGTLDRVIPESWQDENVCRASLLIRGTYQEQQRELLSILVYLVSNRLIFQPGKRRTLPQDGNSDWLYLLQFFHTAGLANPSALRHLVRLSQRSVSLTIIVDILFQAAVIENDVDIARILLKEDVRIDPNRNMQEIPFLRSIGPQAWSALHASVVQGRMNMTKTLIAAGANVDGEMWLGMSPLALAVRYLPPEMAAEFVNLLLEKGAKPNSSKHAEQSPLVMAILSAKAESCKLLRAKGASIHSNSVWLSSYPWHRSVAQPPRWDARPLEWALAVETFGILCLVACADREVDISNRVACMESPSTGIEAGIISTMHVFRDEMKSHVEDEKWSTDLENAMIVAAGRGHTYVLSYLYDLRAEMFGGPKSTHLCYALLVSIQFCQVEACRLLLSWGAALDTTCPIQGNIFKDHLLLHRHPLLPPIHLAALHDSFKLLNVCLEGGLVADIDVPAYIPHKSPYSTSLRCIQCQWSKDTSFTTLHKFFRVAGKVSLRAVSMAILARHEQMALHLLELGAAYTECDLVYAASEGLNAVVKRLLGYGVSSDAADQEGTTALDAALSNRKETVAIQLLEAGATVRPDVVDFGDIWRFEHNVLVKCLLKCHGTIPSIHRGKSYLKWAFRGGVQASIQTALSLDQSAFDCGALCGAISLEARHPCSAHMGFLREMLRRGQMPENIHQLDLKFLTKAMDKAIIYCRLDLIPEIMAAFGAEIRGDVIVQNLPHNRNPSQATVNCSDFELILRSQNEIYQPIKIALTCLVGHNMERMVQGLLDSGFPVDRDTLNEAVQTSLPAEILCRLIERYGTARHDPGLPVDGRFLQNAIYAKAPMDALDKLIDRCDIAAEDGQHGIFLLHSAAQYGDRRLMMRLIDRGAHLSSLNSALSSAVESRDLDMVRFLLQKGVDPNHYHIESPLTTAAENGDIGIVKCLLDFGANLNALRLECTGSWPGTPLEGAAYSGRLDVTRLLLARGLDTEHTGRVQFVRAVMFAKEEGHHGVAQILQEHRPWSPEDEELRRELDQHPCDEETFLHHSEYEGTQLRSRIRQLIQDEDEMPCAHKWHASWWEGGPTTKKILHEAMISVFQEFSPEMYDGSCEQCKTSGWEQPSSPPW